MPFLVSEDISEILDERIRLLKEFDQAKNKATQLHKYSSQIVRDITDVDTSVQIPAKLTNTGIPPTELSAALILLQEELEKIENAQREITTCEIGIRREIENRRKTIFIGGFVTIVVVAVAIFSIFFRGQTSIETEQATTSAKSTATVSEQEPALTTMRTPKSGSTEETILASTFPLKATPVAVVTDAKPLAVDFLIDDIEVEEDNIQLNISIKRHAGSASLSWQSDEDRKNDIYLEIGSQQYHLIDMDGIFTQDTTLQAGRSYEGRFIFEKPDRSLFTFYYPDIKPLKIDLEKLDVQTEVVVSEANTPTPRPVTSTPRSTSTSEPTLQSTASNTPTSQPTPIPTESFNLPEFASGNCLSNKCHVQGFTGGLLMSAYGKTFGLFNSGNWLVEDISDQEAIAVEHFNCPSKSDVDGRVKWGFNIAYCRFYERGAKLGDPFDEGGSIEGEIFKSTPSGIEVDLKGRYGLGRILIKADSTWEFLN